MRLCIVGAFGDKSKAADGQTIKTWSIYEALLNNGSFKILKVDTFSNKYLSAIKLFYCILTCRKIIFLLSENGRKAMIPLFSRIDSLGFADVYQYLIGGRLANEVDSNPKLAYQLNLLSGNWVESSDLVKSLEVRGIENAKLIRNFKNLDICNSKSLEDIDTGVLYFCTFSRVTKKKGILDAIASIERVNAERGRVVCKLDIYGNIEDDFESEFFDKLNESSSCAYKGTVPFDQSVATVASYDALLFPTQHKGEGMPGTLIDAYFAGTPIIARQWNHMPQELIDEKVGIHYEEPCDLDVVVNGLIDNPGSLLSFSHKCVEVATLYSSEVVVNEIVNELLNR